MSFGGACILALPSIGVQLHIPPMATHPGRPRDPTKHSRKDPARPTRAKAARPDSPAMEPALADLLNPAIGKGTAGVGAQTGHEQADKSGLQPPPDNSFD